MGNSEVGHMNLGAGRVIYQNLVKTEYGGKKNTLGLEPGIQMAFRICEIKS